MSLTQWLVLGFALAVVLYAAAVLALVALGRRSDARALAGFIPIASCSSSACWATHGCRVVASSCCSCSPPTWPCPSIWSRDFIPVAGQLDDAILVALVLRAVLRAGGEELLQEHWSGPPRSMELMRRLTFGRRQVNS